MVSELQGNASILHPFIVTYCFSWGFSYFDYVSEFAVQLGSRVFCLFVIVNCAFDYSLFTINCSEQQQINLKKKGHSFVHVFALPVNVWSFFFLPSFLFYHFFKDSNLTTSQLCEIIEDTSKVFRMKLLPCFYFFLEIIVIALTIVSATCR